MQKKLDLAQSSHCAALTRYK